METWGNCQRLCREVVFDLGLEGFYCSPILDGKFFHFEPFPSQINIAISHPFFADSSTSSPLNVGVFQVLYLVKTPFLLKKPNTINMMG